MVQRIGNPLCAVVTAAVQPLRAAANRLPTRSRAETDDGDRPEGANVLRESRQRDQPIETHSVGSRSRAFDLLPPHDVTLPTDTRPASRSTLLALSLGHGSADLCSGALWALLPFLVVERHYSYAGVGVFALVASIATAIVQPLVGSHGDRGEARWLLPVGLLLTGLGIAAVGLTAHFSLTLLAAVISSAGVATYHPEGARWARFAAGSRVTANMGIFSVGGGVGYALDPLLVAAVLGPLGLGGTPLMAVVPLAAAAAVAVALHRFSERRQADQQPLRSQAATSPEWRPFVYLVTLYCLAAGYSTGLLTYLPLFLVHARAPPPRTLLLSPAGTLLGGLAAQRFGRRVVLLAPQLVLVPAIALLPSLSYAGMIPLVILIGMAMNTNVSIALVWPRSTCRGAWGWPRARRSASAAAPADSSWPCLGCSVTRPAPPRCSTRSQACRCRWQRCPPYYRDQPPPRPARCGGFTSSPSRDG